MKPEDLPKTLRKFAHLISEVSDERASGDGYWVYLIEGWRDPDGETHCIHEDTITTCASLMKCIKPCTDPECCRPSKHAAPTPESKSEPTQPICRVCGKVIIGECALDPDKPSTDSMSVLHPECWTEARLAVEAKWQRVKDAAFCLLDVCEQLLVAEAAGYTSGLPDGLIYAARKAVALAKPPA